MAFEPTSCALMLSLLETACITVLNGANKHCSVHQHCPRAKVWLRRVAVHQHELVLDAALGEAIDDSITTVTDALQQLVAMSLFLFVLYHHYHHRHHHYVHHTGSQTLTRARRRLLLLSTSVSSSHKKKEEDNISDNT